MLQRLQDAIARSRAGYTDIRWTRTALHSAGWRGRVFEGTITGTDSGGCVRCLYQGHGWGVATFSDLDELDAAVRRAGELSLAVRPPTAVTLADIPIHAGEWRKGTGEGESTPLSPFPFPLSPGLSDASRLLAHLNGEMLSYDRRVVDTRSVYREEVAEHWVATSGGMALHEVHPDVVLLAAAVARDGGVIERAVDSVGLPAGGREVRGHEELFRATARRAVSLLDARPVRGGTMAVVADQRLAGVIAHETIGHLAEAGAQLRDPLAARLGAPGTKLGSAVLTVGDDGCAAGLRASRVLDDEGTPTANTLLLQHGVMIGRVHTRETAAHFGERPTGNARAATWRTAPAARLRNTYIQSGSGTLQDLIRDVRLGLYACDAVGARRAGVHHAFTASHGYMIRDGEIAEMVKDVVIAGDLPDLLGAVDRVAGDFQWNETGARCRRPRGEALAVCDGAPHIRLHATDVRAGRS